MAAEEAEGKSRGGGRINLFCGDSHARQFRTDMPGVFSTTIASGVTIKGLSNRESTSAFADLVLYQVRIPRTKMLFLMLGGVDLDFTYFHNLCRDGSVDDEVFFRSRIEAYSAFLQRLFEDKKARANLKGVRILAPQPTPVRDDQFEAVTCQHANVTPEGLRDLAAKTDLSQAARIRRLVAFNDMLEQELWSHPRLKVLRIDREMLDADGMLLPHFYGPKAADHHCEQAETLWLWSRKIEADLPSFGRYAKRSLRLARASRQPA